MTLEEYLAEEFAKEDDADNEVYRYVTEADYEALAAMVTKHVRTYYTEINKPGKVLPPEKHIDPRYHEGFDTQTHPYVD